VSRALNVMSLGATLSTWADELSYVVENPRFSTLLVGVPEEDPVGFVRRLEAIAPRLRERVG
jgi:hypothetical protein